MSSQYEGRDEASVSTGGKGGGGGCALRVSDGTASRHTHTHTLSCTNWTRLVLLPVLTGHVSSAGARTASRHIGVRRCGQETCVFSLTHTPHLGRCSRPSSCSSKRRGSRSWTKTGSRWLATSSSSRRPKSSRYENVPASRLKGPASGLKGPAAGSRAPHPKVIPPPPRPPRRGARSQRYASGRPYGPEWDPLEADEPLYRSPPPPPYRSPYAFPYRTPPHDFQINHPPPPLPTVPHTPPPTVPPPPASPAVRFPKAALFFSRTAWPKVVTKRSPLALQRGGGRRRGGGGARARAVRHQHRSPELPARRGPPPAAPRTNRTRRVPHPVLIGHAASLTPY